MANSIAQKLKVKEGYKLLTINAPKEFKQALGKSPENISITSSAKSYNQIHWFVKDKAQMEEEMQNVIDLLKDEVVCWIYYPKGTSKIQTDLTRDKGWEALLKHEELHWISLISFDDTWSAFGMRLKTEKDRLKEAAPKQRTIFDYIDAATKTIYLPEDFAKILKQHKPEEAFFNSLSFTNRKEYVEWIVSAKRDETRSTRVKESIERLGKGWKNPANR